MARIGEVCLFAVLYAWTLSEAATPQDVALANGRFAFTLYKRLANNVDGNVFFSPLSISGALGMVYAGAGGDTRDQMKTALSFDNLGTDTGIHSGFRDLLEALDDPASNYTLDIANRLFAANQGLNLQADYQSTTRDYYKADVELMDFRNDPDGSREDINNWVKDNTNDKIQDLLPEGSITEETGSVLVNAIYFKGLWRIPFDPDDTAPEPFYVTPVSPVQMDMMSLFHIRLDYLEYRDWDCKILELPYEGDKASMIILLPNEKDGLGRLEEAVTMETFNSALDQLQSESVYLKLPKFKLELPINLKAYLMSLGMEDLFDPDKADLSGINGKKDLVVTEAIHKAYVDVTEEGTEAAAATAIITVVSTSVQSSKAKKFVADRPFMFCLRDTETGSILFMGRLQTHTQEGARIGAFGAENRVIGDALVTSYPVAYLSFILLVTLVVLFLSKLVIR